MEYGKGNTRASDQADRGNETARLVLQQHHGSVYGAYCRAGGSEPRVSAACGTFGQWHRNNKARHNQAVYAHFRASR